MNIASSGTGSAAASQIWSGASVPMSPTQKMSNLFDQIDSSDSGSITQDQFSQAFQTMNPPANFQAAGADSVWTSLDPTNSGSVSQDDFVSTMTTLMKQLRADHNNMSSPPSAKTVSQEVNLLTELGTAPDDASTSTIGSNLNTLA